MTILFAGGEDIDFPTGSNSGVQTNFGNWVRSGYTRGSMVVSGGATDSLTNKAVSPLWGSASSSFWASMRTYGGPDTNANLQAMAFCDPSGVRRLILRTTGTSATVAAFKLSKRNAAGTITDIGTFSGTLTNSPLPIKVDLQVSYSASGSATLYWNGVNLGTVTGDFTTDGNTTLQQIEIGGFTGGGAVFAEVIVATTDTRSMALVTLNSTTAGDAQAWTGTAANIVNNINAADGTFIYTTTNDLLQQYKPTTLPAGTATVQAVVMSARMIKGASGPQNFNFVTKIASTNYFSGDISPLSGGFSNFANYQATNPATAAAWTTADLASTNFQFGLRSRA